MEKPFFVFHGTEKILPIPRKNESKQKNGFPVLINAYVRFFFSASKTRTSAMMGQKCNNRAKTWSPVTSNVGSVTTNVTYQLHPLQRDACLLSHLQRRGPCLLLPRPRHLHLLARRLPPAATPPQTISSSCISFTQETCHARRQCQAPDAEAPPLRPVQSEVDEKACAPKTRPIQQLNSAISTSKGVDKVEI